MTEATASGSEAGFTFGASNASTVSDVRCLLNGLAPRRLVRHQRMLKCAEKPLLSYTALRGCKRKQYLARHALIEARERGVLDGDEEAN